MRILVTGLTGTLAPKLAAFIERRDHAVLGWDRALVSPDDEAAGQAFLEGVAPDAVVHLALGSEDWAGRLAGFTRERGLPFILTSTAMVFHHEPNGPHRPHDERTAQDNYGRYKIRCENAALAANPEATVVRIGWQIDPDGQGNNMLAQLDGWQARNRRVAASRLWTPACSFMEDTAAAITDLLERSSSGVHHLDSNAVEGHTFYEVALALKKRFRREGWRVEATQDYRHDQRLTGNEALMPPLSARLPAIERSGPTPAHG